MPPPVKEPMAPNARGGGNIEDMFNTFSKEIEIEAIFLYWTP